MNDKVRSARKLAYQRTFCGDGVTPHVNGERVLADLRRFCHVDTAGIVVSPVNKQTDPFATCYRAGLRDAYMRIALHLGIAEAQVFSTTEEPGHEQAQS